MSKPRNSRTISSLAARAELLSLISGTIPKEHYHSIAMVHQRYATHHGNIISNCGKAGCRCQGIAGQYKGLIP
uniref:hypothetical protein n=1 Tax=Roseivirga sp. TaxID=1964215 RepID=UPI004056CE56